MNIQIFSLTERHLMGKNVNTNTICKAFMMRLLQTTFMIKLNGAVCSVWTQVTSLISWPKPRPSLLRAWDILWSPNAADQYGSLTYECCEIQVECESSQRPQVLPPLKGNSDLHPWFVSESDQVLLFSFSCFFALLLFAFLTARCWQGRDGHILWVSFILHNVGFWSPRQQVNTRPRVPAMSVPAECTRNDWHS